MFCPNCGKKIDNDSKTCIFCGNKIRKKKCKHILIGLFCILVCLAIILCVGYHFENQKAISNKESIKYSDDLYFSFAKDIEIDSTGSMYAKGELIFTINEKDSKVEQLISKYRGEVVGTIKDLNMFQVRFPADIDLEEIVDELAQSDAAIDVAKNYMIPIQYNNMPIDSEYDGVWNETTSVNWNLKAINAERVWNYNQSLKKVNVGIMDAGFYVGEDSDVTFTDTCGLTGQSTIGISEVSHGTHTAGIIGADWDADGIAGIISNRNLYAASTYGIRNIGNYTSYMADSVSLFYLIHEKKCKVINYSMGCVDEICAAIAAENSEAITMLNMYNSEISKVLTKLLDYEFVICKAAGNSQDSTFIVADDDDKNAKCGYILYAKQNESKWKKYIKRENFSELCVRLDMNPYMDLIVGIDDQAIKDRIIIVGAAEQTDMGYQISAYTNGYDKAEIYAPGTNIYSTICKEAPLIKKIFNQQEYVASYGMKSGTSMAAPHVTSAVALIYALEPDIEAEKAKKIVCSSYRNEGFPMLDLSVLLDNMDDDSVWGEKNNSNNVQFVSEPLNIDVRIENGSELQGEWPYKSVLYYSINEREEEQIIYDPKENLQYMDCGYEARYERADLSNNGIDEIVVNVEIWGSTYGMGMVHVYQVDGYTLKEVLYLDENNIQKYDDEMKIVCGGTIRNDCLCIWGLGDSKWDMCEFYLKYENGNWIKQDTCENIKEQKSVVYGQTGTIIEDIKLGSGSGIVLLGNGDAMTFGYMRSGALGRTTGDYHPQVILHNIRSIAHGFYTAAAIDTDDKLWAWGPDNIEGGIVQARKQIPIELMEGVEKVSIGNTCMLILKKDHTLWSLGFGSAKGHTSEDYTEVVKIMDNVRDMEIDASDTSACAITQNNELWIWGYVATNVFSNNKYDVPMYVKSNVISASVENDYIYYIDERHDMYKQTEDAVEYIIGRMEKVNISVDNGLATDIDGNLYSWGEEYYGQLGNGESDYGQIDYRNPQIILSGVEKFVTTYYTAAAVNRYGDYYVWGENINHKLGLESELDGINIPTKLFE